jgi:hypothetical protein
LPSRSFPVHYFRWGNCLFVEIAMARTAAHRAVLVLCLLGLPAAASAGGLAEPRIEPDIIVAETTPSHAALVPLMALVLFGAAISAAD